MVSIFHRCGASLYNWVMSKLRLTIVALCAVVLLAGTGVARASASNLGLGAAHTVKITGVPTKLAITPAGRVGYREVGSGSPVLLIMGLGGSMDDWEPAFVNALAASYRVVMFDNAGIGETASLPAPLSIVKMANETSDFISAIHLGRTAVLGWSMGGMVAQALAVLHPGQVSKLVLAATQPGTGKGLPIPAAAAGKAESASPRAVLSVLFPTTAAAAARAYVTGILGYPDFYVPSRATVAAQGLAVEQWMEGKDAVGRELGDITTPTLVADGTVDDLDPVANDRLIAASIRGAKLDLYPGAGHAFLFQDEASFVPAVEHFLA